MSDQNAQIQETLKLANKLKKQLPILVKMQNDAINKLPENQRSELAKHQSKMNEMIRVAKTGDLNAINEILKQHNADTDTK